MNDDLSKREQLSALVDGESSSLHMQAVLSFAESDEGQQSWRMYHLIGDVLRSPELAHHSQHDILSGVRAHMEREPIRGIHLPGVTAESAKQWANGSLEQVTGAEGQGRVQVNAQANGATVVQLAGRPAANASLFRWKMAAGFASVAAVAAVGWSVMLGSGELSGRQGTAELAQLNPGTVVATTAATPAALYQASPAMRDAQARSDLPLGEQAQSSTVVAVQGPNAQTVMLRDSRLDELLAAHPQYSSAANLQMPASFLRNASFGTANATRH